MNQSDESAYGLSSIPDTSVVAAPQLDYLPPQPKSYRPKIGLIVAGGISEHHLQAYRSMGLTVSAICDLDLERAHRRQQEFYPEALVYDDYQQLLRDDQIEVLDITTHPEDRLSIVESALLAGKHVLSQKPFVLDLDDGQRLVELADRCGVRLAVNQNGRWAPHFSYLTQAIRSDVIGSVSSVDFSLQWDHTWTAGTLFEEIHHLLLYDFGIHWFDIATVLMGDRVPRQVFASVTRAGYQRVKPPFLAQAIIDYDDGQVRLAYNAHVRFGQEDRTIVAGERGVLRAFGPGVNEQQVQIFTEAGIASPVLAGTWFTNGFEGTMGELLCAIEEHRAPSHSAAHVLRSLALCFAALQSANTRQPVVPGTVHRYHSAP